MLQYSYYKQRARPKASQNGKVPSIRWANDFIPDMTQARTTALVCLIATLAAFALSSSSGIAFGGPVSVSSLAPADEYFGHQKLSPLGIRHEIYSLKDDLHHARQKPDAIEQKAEYVEDAIDDWIARYPNDPWIASAAWQLATLFEELPGNDAREHAIVVLGLVKSHYPSTPFGADASRDLARGIGVRPWPHWAGPPPDTVAQRGATPSPSAPSSAAPSASPSAAPDALPTDAASLVAAIVGANATPDPQRLLAMQSLEERFWSLSHGGTDASYVRAAWELAAAYERLPGDDSKTRAIRLLALLVDRYPGAVFGRWAMRDLERGIGDRS